MKKYVFLGIAILGVIIYFSSGKKQISENKERPLFGVKNKETKVKTPLPLPPIPQEYLEKRKVVDSKLKPTKKKAKKTKPLNKPNKNWKKLLKKKISKNLKNVKIEEAGGHYIVEEDKGVFVEKVKVTHAIGSFKAIVDSENGSPLVTYDHKGEKPKGDSKINRVDLKGSSELMHLSNKISEYYGQFKYRPYSDKEKQQYGKNLKN